MASRNGWGVPLAEHPTGTRLCKSAKAPSMPYALFEKEAKLSRAFPTATDVWRCAEGCGLVVDGADGKPRLEDDSRGRLKHQAVRAGPGPGRGTGLGPEPAKNLTCAGTKPTPRSYPGKCSNLERGESMKDPVSVLGCWRGFSIWGLRGSTPLKERSSLRRDRPRFRDRRTAHPGLADERSRAQPGDRRFHQGCAIGRSREQPWTEDPTSGV
jgi:hypothetical protein